MPCPLPIAGPLGGPAPRVRLPGRVRGTLLSPVKAALCPLAGLFWFLAVASCLAAQAPADGVVVQAYTFRYQRAAEAVALVDPLLSAKGSIELQPGGNTLVVRDTPAAIKRILPVLRRFDHPPQSMRVEIYIVRASRSVVSPQVRRSDLPEELTQRLQDLLAYDVFETQAQTQLAGVEGQSVTYELGQQYTVSFRFGMLTDNQRVKLMNFRISRQNEGRPAANLLQANLTLWKNQTMSLGLAKSEASREALMLVMTLRDGDAPRKQP